MKAFVIDLAEMRGSYNGNTLAFQARAAGSIPVPRSIIQIKKNGQIKFGNKISAHVAQW